MCGALTYLACVALALVGCSASDDDVPGAEPMDDELENEAAYVDARSEIEQSYREDCCQEAGARGAEDQADVIRRGLLVNRPSSGSGARYDADAALDCLRELLDRGCAHAKDSRVVVSDSACNRIYRRGNVAIGESCESFYDCAESGGVETTCGVAHVTADGISYACKALERAREGEPCVSQNPSVEYDCEWPLLCHEDAGVCVARAARGEQCITGPVWGDTCAMGSVCDRLDTKICVEPIAEGEPCEDGERCEYLACEEGLCRPPIYEPAACIW